MRCTLVMVMVMALCGCHGEADCGIPEGDVTVQRSSGCGEPTADELAALLTDDGTPCFVREREDYMCETTLETECMDGDAIWEWRGTLMYDGDGYSGRLARRELRDGVLCNGEFWVEVR